MTRARSLLHAGGVFAAVLAVGFVLTTGGAWATRGLADSLAGAAVVVGITALGTIASAGAALVLGATTYAARRNHD